MLDIKVVRRGRKYTSNKNHIFLRIDFNEAQWLCSSGLAKLQLNFRNARVVMSFESRVGSIVPWLISIFSARRLTFGKVGSAD